MKREPLTDARGPGYPTREEGEREAARHLPRRWQRQAQVAGAVALFFFPAACSRDPGAVGGESGGAIAADQRRRRKEPPVLSQVFEHGEGRGAFGCVAIAPPAFLTEADARQVILEEFARAGVTFQQDVRAFPAVMQERVTVAPGWEPDNAAFQWLRRKLHLRHRIIETRQSEGPMVLDGFDPAHHIGFEYISEDDYGSLGTVPSMSSVEHYDFKATASDVARRAAKDDELRIGTFYDPMAAEGGDPEPAREQLRRQVDDFIDWLRKNGVL